MKQGDAVEVIDEAESGWWLVRICSGENEEVCGYVPAAYLEKTARQDSIEVLLPRQDGATIENPIYGMTSLSSDEETFEGSHQENDAIASKSPTLQSPQDYDSGDSISSCESSSQGSSCDVMRDKLRDLSRESSFENWPFVTKERWSDPTGNWTAQSSYQHASPFRSFDSPTKVEAPNSTEQRSTVSFNTAAKSRPTSIGSINVETNGEDYICTKSFEANSEEELSFIEGSILSVLQRSTSGWWLAR